MASNSTPAPHRIIDRALGRVVFAPGDPMSPEDVEKYLGERNQAEEPTEPEEREVKPQADRAHKPQADRSGSKKPKKSKKAAEPEEGNTAEEPTEPEEG